MLIKPLSVRFGLAQRKRTHGAIKLTSRAAPRVAAKIEMVILSIGRTPSSKYPTSTIELLRSMYSRALGTTDRGLEVSHALGDG